MGALLIVLSVIAFGGQFSVSKLYKVKVGDSSFGDFFFNFMTGAISVVLFLVVCLGNVGFHSFSLLMAFAISACFLVYTLCSLKAVMYGKLAVFTLFLMLGGMALPFFYGVIFLDEKLSVWKIIGMVLLVASLVFSSFEKTGEEKKNSRIFYILCLVGFFCNGFVSVFSKMHQIRAGVLDTFQFTFWQSVFVTVFGGLLLLYSWLSERKKEEFPVWARACVSPKSLGIIFLETFIMRGGNVLILLAAKEMPASVLYPVITGGTILVTTLMGRVFFKEKVSPVNWAALAVTAASVVLMIF